MGIRKKRQLYNYVALGIMDVGNEPGSSMLALADAQGQWQARYRHTCARNACTDALARNPTGNNLRRRQQGGGSDTR